VRVYKLLGLGLSGLWESEKWTFYFVSTSPASTSRSGLEGLKEGEGGAWWLEVVKQFVGDCVESGDTK
jgi:hypothetical protein